MSSAFYPFAAASVREVLTLQEFLKMTLMILASLLPIINPLAVDLIHKFRFAW
jgi:hypothetical protein